MNRSDATQLIEAALAAGQAAYARQVAQRYLADWPGDLDMQLALARAAAAEPDTALAVRVLEALTGTDPEDYRAQRLLGQQLLRLGQRPFAAHAFACAHVGDGLGAPAGLAMPAWTAGVRAAGMAERVGDWETAQRESQAALPGDMPTPLPSLIHLAALWHAGQCDLALPLAEGFHQRWPRVIAFKLCLAECLFAREDRVRALELLHDAAAQDLTGRVAARHWGKDHPYRSLWAGGPGALAGLPGPLPAPLISALGLNRLKAAPPRKSEAPAAEAPVSQAEKRKTAPGILPQAEEPGQPQPAAPSQPRRTVEEIADIRAQLDAIAKEILGEPDDPDPNAPPREEHYLILSSHTRLVQVYGQEGFEAVDRALRALALAATARTRMPARVVYVDQPASLQPFNLRPVNPGNAWDVKTLLADLSAGLKRRRAAIGAVLIAGGDEIIPFHRLPNPTDDADPDIPSDNPYATADENYFVPEWPVGRIPSGAGSNPAPLLRALRTAAEMNEASKAGSPARGWLARLWRWLLGRRAPAPDTHSFGYSANVWRGASQAVYTIIGNPRDLLTSPPVDANALPAAGLAPSRLSYFNLHGVEDGPEWYGQRSFEDPATAPEYPVALRPADVVNSGRAPVVVFSEACYGANIAGKTVDDALCLRFLDSGSRAVVASTKIAYGSVSTPLIGADLLGWLFWQNVNAGLPAGEALRRAKLQMAQEMHTRQGFLDGEDQKTLISFVLYGDPLLTAPGAQPQKSAKRSVPSLQAPATVCDRSEAEASLTPESVAHIKAAVTRYLPGMQDAQWRVARAHAECASHDHLCPTAHLAARAHGKLPAPRRSPRYTVVTLSKTIRASARAHPHFARLTFDEAGEVVKMAVSR